MTSGSGAFLITACNRLALELARVRTEPTVPDDDAIQEAKRDVLQSCIYGVDLNPMAVELTKVSLWINAMVKDKPLNFLDHHVKCGNSLIGATPELIAKGVPDEAFKAVTGDDKKISKHFKDINKKQRIAKGVTLFRWSEKALMDYADDFSRLSDMVENTAEGVVDKCKEYHRLKDTEYLRRKKLLADAWTAAFFVPLNDNRYQVPTSEVIMGLAEDICPPDAMIKKIEEFAHKHKFFHWYLEFPEVFAEGGFDVVLGNPPWEKVQIEEIPFFSLHRPDLDLRIASKRKMIIKHISEEDPILYNQWLDYKMSHEKESKFIRNSGCYPLTGTGKFNTYALFAELAQKIVSNNGQSGLVIPSGIATDNNNSNFFSTLISSKTLTSLYEFENSQSLFPGIHRQTRFCLLTTSGEGIRKDFVNIASELSSLDQLNNPNRHISIGFSDFSLFNPNTLTAPKFRTIQDYEIARRIYSFIPPLIKEYEKLENPWNADIRVVSL
jgi:hypothetical protein